MIQSGMDNGQFAELLKRLDKMNYSLEKISGTFEKPKNPVITIIEVAAAGATVFGIFHAIDVLIKWITGG